MLDLDQVEAYYGDSHILHGVSFAVREGRGCFVLLRPQRCRPKTTTIMTVMGYLHPRTGRISLRR